MNIRIASVVCFILSVLISFFLITGVINYQNDMSEDRQKFSQFEKELAEQESIKREAQRNIFHLNETLKNVEKKATVSIILCGMNDEIYTHAFPILQKYGITGTIVMTGNTLPGGNGRLNDGQIFELYNSGWKIIPGWSEGDGNNGITSSAKWISDYGYSSDGVVYINSEFVTDDIKNTFAAEGYTTIVTDIGFGSIDAISTTPAGGLWNINAMGYMSNGPKNILEEAIETYGNFAFTVGFENEDELFNEAKLSSMIEYLKSHEKNGFLYIGTVSEAYDYRVKMDQRVKEAEDIISVDIADNQKNIDAADAAIKELYNIYLD